MMKNFRYTIAGAVVIVAATALLYAQESKPATKPAATLSSLDVMERSRREVRMLDDIYKGGVVTITQHYVTDEDAIPAGTAFKKLFEAAAAKGWHEVRLVDATGDPLSDENVARGEFEKAAIKKLVAGESWVESVEVRDGTKHLRVATAIPVVFEKCIMCHDNYEDVPKGKAIGALTYAVPIDGPLVVSKPEKK